MSNEKLFDDEHEEKDEEPVTCLGLEFENEEARRDHFIALLREKLQDSEFRATEGFPLGSDEDILALSDPPYYTACPNPWIADFIEEWEAEKPDKPEDYQYHREPFAADVSEGKNDPIYNAHSYHTKVPHKAIMRYILHYTEPGDIVFDGFCGTGMTGVAAQMCGNREEVILLGYQVKPDGTILQEETDENGKKTWKAFSKLGARRAVLNDLSPAATFIAYNYNTPVDVNSFEREAKRILAEVEEECGWMYETLHTSGEGFQSAKKVYLSSREGLQPAKISRAGFQPAIEENNTGRMPVLQPEKISGAGFQPAKISRAGFQPAIETSNTEAKNTGKMPVLQPEKTNPEKINVEQASSLQKTMENENTGRMPVLQSEKMNVEQASSLQKTIKNENTGKMPVLRLREFKQTKRDLPHWQYPGAILFITFNTYEKVQLSDEAKDEVLSAIKHWDGSKIKLISAVVMNDHVHILLKLLQDEAGSAEDIATITHSIKSYSANQINKVMNRSGILWQAESYDHIIRDERDFHNTLSYIWHNPVKKEFCVEAESYRWYYRNDDLEDAGWKPALQGRINYTVWSDVFVCPECSGEIVFWEVAVDKDAGKVRDQFPCPHCLTELTKRTMERTWTTKYDEALQENVKQAKQVPVLINYSVEGMKGRFEKCPDENDLALINKIEKSTIPYDFPTSELPDGYNTRQPIRSHGITHVHHFYTKRNLWILATLRSRTRSVKISSLQYWLNSLDHGLGKRVKHGNYSFPMSVLTGTLYIPSMGRENNPLYFYTTRYKKHIKVFSHTSAQKNPVTCQSSEFMNAQSDTFNYIFIDPPFGANLNYSELNFLWESWLKVWTNNKPEAIENSVQGKGPEEYRQLMTACFKEAYRVLKPGHWMTVEFSNTKASVWNSIQTAIAEAGFIVANVSTLDKKQGSFKAVTTTTAVKQDLVISAYKPNGGFEERFVKEADTEEGVWDFVRTHMTYLPVTKSRAGFQPAVEENNTGKMPVLQSEKTNVEQASSLQKTIKNENTGKMPVLQSEKISGAGFQPAIEASNTEAKNTGRMPVLQSEKISGAGFQPAIEAKSEAGFQPATETNNTGRMPVLQFVPERDPRILYDHVVAYYVRKGHAVPISSQEFQEGLPQRFIERDGMFFSSEQAAEYDKKRMIYDEPIQGSLFVSDEASAISWLRNILREKPQTFQNIHPQFLQEISGWSKHEESLELSLLLEQNFLKYEGRDEVPGQIHNYLSKNWHDMRNLSKDNPSLKSKAKDRWYVPDPNKTGDLERLREKALLREFEGYQTLKGKLKTFRIEAVRAGFKKAWQEGNYKLIITMADKIPRTILDEDPKLLMWYGNARTRTGEE